MPPKKKPIIKNTNKNNNKKKEKPTNKTGKVNITNNKKKNKIKPNKTRNTNVNSITVNNIITDNKDDRKNKSANTISNINRRAPSLPQFASVNQLHQLQKDEINNKIKNFDDRVKMLGNENNFSKNNDDEKDSSKFEIPKLDTMSASEKINFLDKGETTLLNSLTINQLDNQIKQLNGNPNAYKNKSSKIAALQRLRAKDKTLKIKYDSNIPSTANTDNNSTPLRKVRVTRLPKQKTPST